MPKIVIFLLIFFCYLNAKLLDNIYIFGEYSKTNKSQKDFILKISKEKTIEFKNDSFIFINPLLTIHKKDEGNRIYLNKRMREFYFNSYYLDELFNLQIGRTIKTFDFTQISILNFLSKSSSLEDPNDRNLEVEAMDGISLTLNDIKSDNTRYLTIHTYVENIFNKEKRHNQKSFLELTESGDSYNRSIFIFNDNRSYPALALAYSGGVNDNIIYSSIIKYKFDGYFNSATNTEYSLTSNNSIGLEAIYLGGKISSKNERIKKHQTFKNKQDFINLYNDLNSELYLLLYNRNKILDISTRISWLENIKDNSKRFNAEISYNFDNGININIQGIIFIGEENSEFGYIKNNSFNNKIKFFIIL